MSGPSPPAEVGPLGPSLALLFLKTPCLICLIFVPFMSHLSLIPARPLRPLSGRQIYQEQNWHSAPAEPSHHPGLLCILPVLLSRNNARRASHRSPDRATPPLQSRRPSTSRYPPSPGCTGKHPRPRAAGPMPSAPLLPPRCNTCGKSAGLPAGPWAGPAAPR